MTIIKAMEILNDMYDEQLEKEKLYSEALETIIQKIDITNNKKMALLTAIDALKEKCDTTK
jgi:hypothetical protein